ncbi:MAG: transketolase family protein [Alphaproteobacteria bacterium]
MSNLHLVLGQTLKELGEKDPNIVCLSGDVKNSTGVGIFAEHFPNRYFEMGISEQNMIGVAAGMALEGKIPFVSSYACFSPGRNWEQIRNSICLQNANVKIIGAHIGFAPAKDGATHQCFEDLALMRCLPNLKILSPFDDYDCKLCTKEAANHKGPVYLRLSRYAAVKLGKRYDEPFVSIKDGKDIALIATGAICEKALNAAAEYQNKTGKNIAVFGASHLKPLDTKKLELLAPKFSAVITVEEHQINCGFGSSIAEILSEKSHTKVFRIGMPDCFGTSGETEQLYQTFGLDETSIFNTIENVFSELKL